MASFTERIEVAAPQAQTWEVASDLSRLGDWLTMHEAWRGEVPRQLQVGTKLTSVVNVKGMRNRIAWTVTAYDPPRQVVLTGLGVGGTQITLNLGVDAVGSGSAIVFDVDFSGKLVKGPVGMAVKRALSGDVRRSIDRLAALVRTVG